MFLNAVEKTISETDQDSHCDGLESWHTELRHPSPPGQQRQTRCHAPWRRKLGLAPQPPCSNSFQSAYHLGTNLDPQIEVPRQHGVWGRGGQLALFFPTAAASQSYEISPRFNEQSTHMENELLRVLPTSCLPDWEVLSRHLIANETPSTPRCFCFPLMFQGVLIKTSYELPGSNKFLFSPIFLVITSPHFVIGGFPGHHLRLNLQVTKSLGCLPQV